MGGGVILGTPEIPRLVPGICGRPSVRVFGSTPLHAS